MKTFALACTSAIALGIMTEDANYPPGDIDVSYLGYDITNCLTLEP